MRSSIPAPSRRKTVAPKDRKLSEVARYLVYPESSATTSWPKVRDTCRRLGWYFDGWQDGAGQLILAKSIDGMYAADTVVISIPRQVGKTYLIACLIYGLCLLEPGLTVIWTAHRKATAAETFAQFDGMAQRPTVAPHIRQVLRGKGDEKILFNNGSRILFGARESGFGRGFSDVDVLVFDEAQIMTAATMEDMAASQNVAKNPLTFMMGTPPRPKDPGEVFTLLRQEALEGDAEGLIYIETSADRGADLMDRDQWRKANPSFPHRTSDKAMRRLRKKLTDDDSWRREALGIWDEVVRHVAVVKASDWADLVDVGPDNDVRPNALAVDMSHEREISISACWVNGESAHCEEVWAGVDPDAAMEWLFANARYRIPVIVDAQSPASSFVPTMRMRRMKVIQTTAGDMAKACGMFVDKTNGKNLSHADQQAVNDALAGGRKRAIGVAGGWGWDRKDETVNIAPIVSMTLALFGGISNTRPVTSGRSRTTRRGTSR
ncbi:terminase [Nocardia sp. 852002-20019_SCH5090214]|uniref:DEAD/DEAH box helicase family protein n=1 Tax=Nocardia sp. 852002-20019_SCH5090214 TaxID=1834087 RepID=UPI0007EB0E2E|nr:DEAD/DEAH box helicase family protein [Nocardia sp. 852002-20019_SCH5090214]OBA62196.1 terminase [Nocardia sp. 852002-20019_SCH5090214]